VKKRYKRAKFQTSNSPNYANREALFDSENNLPGYNLSIVKKFYDFLAYKQEGFTHVKQQVILDFGAGSGTLAGIFKDNYQISPICCEIDPELSQILLSKNFRHLSNLKELNTPVSMIYSSNVLEHIEDDSVILCELGSKLQKGGKLAIYVPALMFLFSELDTKAGHFRRYSKNDLISKVSSAGFKVESCYYSDSIGVLASLILKVFGYRNRLNLGSGKSLVFYDRVVYPLSQLLDRLGMKYLLGKNLYIFAIKK
jgi:hypothetical protein